MTMLSPFLSIDSSCDQALRLAKAKLSQKGFSAVQTFDLNTARLGMQDCGCPNHGTGVCDCQMIVLLVYGEAPEPATLILHGNDGKTWISIADTHLPQGNAKLIAAIQQALEDLVSAGVSTK
jgi:hypothetical protein